MFFISFKQQKFVIKAVLWLKLSARLWKRSQSYMFSYACIKSLKFWKYRLLADQKLKFMFKMILLINDHQPKDEVDLALWNVLAVVVINEDEEEDLYDEWWW